MITCESCDKFLTLQVTGYENGRIEITCLRNSTDFSADPNQNQNQNSYSFCPHVGPINSISFGLIDEVPYFISAGSDGKLILWFNLNGDWSQKIIFKSKVSLTSAAFSCDSSIIAAIDQEGTISFIDPKNKVKVKSFMHLPNEKDQNTSGSLIVVTPTGELHIYKIFKEPSQDINYDELEIYEDIDAPETDKYYISKSYVKGLAPLDYCYVAAICFDNIIRVFDIRMLTTYEINLGIKYEEKNDESLFGEKISYVNYNPLYALRWEEPLRRLIVCVQKQYCFSIDSQADIKNICKSFISPSIKREKITLAKNPIGSWIIIKNE